MTKRALIGLAVVAVLLIGCEATSESKIRDLINKWNENSIETISRSLFGTSTGNEGQDGLIDGVSRIDEQDGVTQNARSALANGDTDALDDLIAKYPGDYGLRLMRGANALANGDTGSFVSDFTDVRNVGQIAVVNTKIVELKAIADLVEGQWRSVNQCDEYYGSLSQLHRQRFEISHRQSDLDEAARYDALHTQTCSALPR
jgi:hypothetical protein